MILILSNINWSTAWILRTKGSESEIKFAEELGKANNDLENNMKKVEAEIKESIHENSIMSK